MSEGRKENTPGVRAGVTVKGVMGLEDVKKDDAGDAKGEGEGEGEGEERGARGREPCAYMLPNHSLPERHDKTPKRNAERASFSTGWAEVLPLGKGCTA
jgi:hypothetical protein